MEPVSSADWQKNIYLNGFAGFRPGVSLDWNKLEAQACSKMSPEAFAYIAGGAGNEFTIRANRDAFDQLSIIPRVLRDVSDRSTQIELLGKKIPSPILLAPVGVLEMVHPLADLAVGKAASSLELPFIFSNQASFSMEEVAAVMKESPRWFQLYWSKSNDLVVSFLKRAEKCSCSAIVVTLDTTLLGWRTRDLELAYLPFLEGKGIAQYTSDKIFKKLMHENSEARLKPTVTWQSVSGLIKMVNHFPGQGFFKKWKSGDPIKAVGKFVGMYSNPAVTWDDLSFLRAHTRLPILLKGILHPDDAIKSIDCGMDGIIVSNHGGRQVDGCIASMTALSKIAPVVKGKIPILLDSGVRGGADIFKALALGATAVCVGRPYVYGLTVGGQSGVEQVIRNITTEFELTMALAGCKNVNEINSDCIAVK